MKKVFAIFLALICLLSLGGCGKEENADVLHLGLNAEITEINAADCSITVKDADESQNIFGGKCIVDCSNADILYVDYDGNDSENVKFIEFEELAVGDKVILNIYDSELKDSQDDRIAAESVQLATQRLMFSRKSELIPDDFPNSVEPVVGPASPVNRA